MKLRSVMRYTYSLGWVFGALAIGYRLIDRLFPKMIEHVPTTPRGMLFFSAFLFLCTIATGIYAQVMSREEKPASAASTASKAA